MIELEIKQDPAFQDLFNHVKQSSEKLVEFLAEQD